MHGERDLLMRSVLPALQARVLPHRISLHAIDLRWGITEEETRRNRYRATAKRGWGRDERTEWCSQVTRAGTARTNEDEGGVLPLRYQQDHSISTLPSMSQGPLPVFLPGLLRTAPPPHTHTVIPFCPHDRAYRQLEVCLGEVENSELFVGILGSRYGYVPPSYDLPDHPHFHWVRETRLEGLGRKQEWEKPA